jgi:transcriptional regulator with XRE-family HTH domain
MSRNASMDAVAPNRLHEALRAGGRRMDWLSRKTGYSVGHVSRVANGHAEASDQFVKLVCAALDLPASYVFPDKAA